MNTETACAAKCNVHSWILVASTIGILLCYSGRSFARGGTELSGRQQTGTEAERAAKQAGDSPGQNAAFDARDLSGIWRVGGGEVLSKQAPPMTPWAQTQYNAAKPGIGPRSQSQGNDPISACNPPGFPRILLFGAYPLEIVRLPDRILQFYDFFYTYRTIWTDGQSLPKNPVQRWYGYSVGRWEGNTLVVDSSGFDDRSWLDEDGHPHSSDMRIEERYERISPDEIRLTMTLTDPKAYAQPWVSDVKILKRDTKDKMQEDLCAPADEERYQEEMKQPAATPAQQP
jgi:hypothetical protein